MKKKTKELLIFIVIFLIGLGILAFPYVSQVYYKFKSNNEVVQFEREIKKLDNKDIEKRIELAKIYNKTLDNSLLSDPYTNEKKEEAVKEYARMLSIHELIGYAEIPSIEQNLPIYASTSEEVLQKGLGHLEGSSLPVGGKSTHTVITGHRGLPTNKLFTDLDKMKLGDVFYIHNLKETLAYKVDQILVVEPNNFDPILIQNGKDYATLLTCTPYMVNSHRLLVRGHRIDYVAPIQEKNIIANDYKGNFKIYLYVALALFITLLTLIIYYNNKIKVAEEKITQIKKKN